MYVEPTNVKQIAGRAGRLSSAYKEGLVTTWQEADLAYVRAVLNFDVPEIAHAGAFSCVIIWHGHYILLFFIDVLLEKD